MDKLAEKFSFFKNSESITTDNSDIIREIHDKHAKIIRKTLKDNPSLPKDALEFLQNQLVKIEKLKDEHAKQNEEQRVMASASLDGP